MSAALMGAALTAVGCSSLAPEDDTYTTKVLGVNPDQTADWSCLGQAQQAPPILPQDAMVTYTFPLVEWVSNAPLANRSIQVCNRIDPDCLMPLPSVSNIVEGEANVSVTFKAGTSVFLLLKAKDVFDTTLYFDGPLYADQEGGKIQMLTGATVFGLANQVKIPLQQDLGVLAIRPHDCRGTIVSGALYTIDAVGSSAVPYTFVNGLPRAAPPPPMPAVSTTIPSDNTPWAGFVNVPPIGVTVYGVLADGNKEIGSADVAVRAGAINVVEIRALNHL